MGDMQVGKDAYAAMLRGALQGCGVDTSLVTSVAGSSGTAIVLLQPGGERHAAPASVVVSRSWWLCFCCWCGLHHQLRVRWLWQQQWQRQ